MLTVQLGLLHVLQWRIQGGGGMVACTPPPPPLPPPPPPPHSPPPPAHVFYSTRHRPHRLQFALLTAPSGVSRGIGGRSETPLPLTHRDGAKHAIYGSGQAGHTTRGFQQEEENLSFAPIQCWGTNSKCLSLEKRASHTMFDRGPPPCILNPALSLQRDIDL